jgi:hypothetical protein
MHPRSSLRSRLFLVLLTSPLSLLAQTPAAPPPTDPGADARNRRTFNPEELRDRMLRGVREQFQVEDDAEWAIISEHLQKVSELRRVTGAGMGGLGNAMALRGTPPGGGSDGRRGPRPGPEVEALGNAIRTNATPAEIKARLERFRTVRKENEAKLTAAQEELRSLLNVRQEAIAVMFGLLP